MKLTQKEYFKDVNNPWFNILDVHKDNNGLLCLKSPITNSENDFRRSIVLDLKHLLVMKLIKYKHQQLNHARIQTVMNNLREIFWIL